MTKCHLDYVRKAEQGQYASVCWTRIVFENCASYSASGLDSSYMQTPSTCISSKAEWKCYRFDSGVFNTFFTLDDTFICGLLFKTNAFFFCDVFI